MSNLEALQAEVQSYRTEAGELAEHFSQVHAQVENDPSLTVTGKRERLKPLHAETTQQIAALHAREKAAVKTVKEGLERRLFGLSPGAAATPARLESFRAAQDRARRLEDADEAEAMYRSALRSDDDVMARAVLEQALARGWSSIKADFLERHKGTSNDLDDLEALAKYNNNSLFNLTHYVPPSLNLPHAAGFPDITPLHTRAEPQRPPSLADVMGQAAARAEAAQYPYGR